MLSLRFSAALVTRRHGSIRITKKPGSFVVCAANDPQPRYRSGSSRQRNGMVSKAAILVARVKGLSNVKEEIYGALDSFIAWDLDFPSFIVKRALKILENQREWKRVIQVTKWMLSKGQGRTMGSYCSLVNALAQDGRLDEAEALWSWLFSENLEFMPRGFFVKMISIYYSRDMHDKMFEVFADMEELGIRPDASIIAMVGRVFQRLGMMDKYEKLKKKYPPVRWEYRKFKGRRVRVKVR